MQDSMVNSTPRRSPTAPRTLAASPASVLISAPLAFSGRSKKAASWRSSDLSTSVRRRVARRWPMTPKHQPCSAARRRPSSKVYTGHVGGSRGMQQLGADRWPRPRPCRPAEPVRIVSRHRFAPVQPSAQHSSTHLHGLHQQSAHTHSHKHQRPLLALRSALARGGCQALQSYPQNMMLML